MARKSTHLQKPFWKTRVRLVDIAFVVLGFIFFTLDIEVLRNTQRLGAWEAYALICISYCGSLCLVGIVFRWGWSVPSCFMIPAAILAVVEPSVRHTDAASLVVEVFGIVVALTAFVLLVPQRSRDDFDTPIAETSAKDSE